jgi:hypothetical protein
MAVVGVSTSLPFFCRSPGVSYSAQFQFPAHMSSPSHQNWIRIARRVLRIGAMIIVISILALPFYAMNGHPVRIGSLSLLTTSSTQADVKTLLGRPSHVNSEGGNVLWRYTSFTWCMVTIEFGPDGKLKSIDHDH